MKWIVASAASIGLMIAQVAPSVAGPATSMPATVPAASNSIAEFVGTYPLTSSIDAAIVRDGPRFMLTLGHRSPALIEPAAPDRWSVPELGITLGVAGTGATRELRIGRYGQTVSLTRGADELRLAREATSIPAALDRLTPRCMIGMNVPGVSIALVQNRELGWRGQYGVRNADQPDRVQADTVFEAASMSKPVFAYVVMQLVQEGRLDLDRPLVQILGHPYIDNDPRHERITARMALSHTTGFPNWRPGGAGSNGPIPMLFDPGTQFGYSGEGILFLQRAVETLLGQPADQFMQARLLRPLQMDHSSYVWQDRFRAIAAAGHDEDGTPRQRRPLYRSPNMAYTLYTTPSDYAEVLIEMLRQDRSASHSLSPATLKQMLTPTSDVPQAKPVDRRGNQAGATVHFALGWRLEKLPEGNRYEHSGSNGTGFRSYCEFNPKTGNGIVIMTNSNAGVQLWRELMSVVGE